MLRSSILIIRRNKKHAFVREHAISSFLSLLWPPTINISPWRQIKRHKNSIPSWQRMKDDISLWNLRFICGHFHLMSLLLPLCLFRIFQWIYFEIALQALTRISVVYSNDCYFYAYLTKFHTKKIDENWNLME